MSAGATSNDWDTFSFLLGLTPDLLPVVSNPAAVISPDSTMNDLGKTPSRYNRQGQVVGIPKWSQHVATDRDIARWAAQPDYGICVQTREVRAIDVDVPDVAAAAAIGEFIYEHLGAALPRRQRSNSGKFLLAFRLPGGMRKRVIKVAGGIIEFLGTGQQFIAVGTHPSGARYEWADGLPDDFPALGLDQFEALWVALAARFGTEPPVTQRADTVAFNGAAVPVDADQLRKALATIPNSGAAELEYDDWLHVIMALHYETGASDAGLALAHEFSARSAKYNPDEVDLEWGRINNVSNSASGRVLTGAHILGVARAHGWSDADPDDFAVVAPRPRKPGAPAEPPPLPNFIRNKNGEILVTMDNLVKAIDRPDMTGMLIAHDRFREEIMCSRDNGENWAPFTDADYTKLRIELERRGFQTPGKEVTRDAALLVATINAFDSAQLWLGRLDHDGAPRVEMFMHRYFGAEDTPYTRAMSRYIWTALAGRVIEPGCQVDMTPIFIGAQGARKSSAIAAMVPHRDLFAEMAFGEKDDDLARKMRGRLIVEFAELKGLHGRDSEAIKAWLTKRVEDWTPKFKEFNTKYPRRLLFIGTSNKDEILADATGHRRWLPTYVADWVDLEAIQRDCLQLWAEGRDLFTADGIDYKEAETLARNEHSKYEMHDEWENAVAAWLDSSDEMDDTKPADRAYLLTHEVLSGALNKEAKNCTRIDEMRIGTVLRTLGYARKKLRDGKRLIWAYART